MSGIGPGGWSGCAGLPCRRAGPPCRADNRILLSASSAWEISIKHALGRLPLPQALTPAGFIPEARTRHQVEPLPVDEADIFLLGQLPQLHQDPFDRLLVCQAIARQALLLTPDPLIAQYPVAVLW